MNSTIFLYIVILVILCILAYFIPKNRFRYSDGLYIPQKGFFSSATLLLLVYTLFWGLRYNVGTDYHAYAYIFEHETLASGTKEAGMYIINSVLNGLGFSYVSFFLLTSFIIFYSILRYARNYNRLYLILLIYFLFTTSSVFFSQNGIRQYLAMMLVIGFLDKLVICRKWYIWMLFVLLAYNIHHSVVIPALLIILLFIYPKTIIINKYVLLTIYLSFVFLGQTYQEVFFNRISDYLSFLDYERYIDRVESLMGESVRFGLGVVLQVLSAMLVIFYQERFLCINKKDMHYYLYYFFIIGSMLMFVCAGNRFLGRMNSYFFESIYFTLAYLCMILFKSGKIVEKLFAIFIMLAYFALFIANLKVGTNGVVPYNTIFNAHGI